MQRRHEFDRPIIETNLAVTDDTIADYLKKVDAGNYRLVRALPGLTYQNLCSAAALGIGSERQLRYLDLFIDASLAAHRMSLSIGAPIVIELDGRRHEVVPPDLNYLVSDQSWLAGYFAARARRNVGAVKAFCELDIDLITQQSDTKGGSCSLLLAKFFQRLLVRGEPHGESLLAIAAEIAPEKMPDATCDYALHVDGPLVDTLTPMLMGDSAEFNTSLAEALALHAKYWTREPRNSTDGFISVALTALAVTAVDQGVLVDQHSEYLLSFLLDG